MTYPLDNIKQIEINNKIVNVLYKNGTKISINIPNWHITRKDQITGEVKHQHHNSVIFQTNNIK